MCRLFLHDVVMAPSERHWRRNRAELLTNPELSGALPRASLAYEGGLVRRLRIEVWVISSRRRPVSGYPALTPSES